MIVPGFTEQWFSQASQDALAELARSVADIDGDIVEIGSWEGRSTCAMANAIHPRIVHAVDTWAGSPGEISADLAARRDVYARFTANVAHYTRGNVAPHRMGWRDWARHIDGPLALVFIDAEHTYREVFDAIDAVRPHLAAGGVLCGDDVHHPPIIDAVNDQFGRDGWTQRASLWIWRHSRKEVT